MNIPFQINRIKRAALIRMFLLGMLLFTAASTKTYAVIHIGGDVYGGGRNGAVGTGFNATLFTTQDEVDTENNQHLTTDSLGRNPGDAGYVTTYEEGYIPVSIGDKNNNADFVNVKLEGDNPQQVTKVTVKSGKVRTIFGGGENGRVFGSSVVNVSGGEVGDSIWEGSIHGGIFGAGDGKTAQMFGYDSVTITGGTIYNNIYGGGNQAPLVGTATVILRGGSILGSVFGGSRMAGIFGYTFVNIDGENAITDLIIKAVYGGNDICGRVSSNCDSISSGDWEWTKAANLSAPFLPKATSVDNTWNGFIRSTASISKNIFVGRLHGGGNGNYNYVDGTVTLIDQPGDSVTYVEFTGLTGPKINRTYIELNGGTFGYVFGGGNAATVNESADICLDNPTEDLALIPLEYIPDLEAELGPIFIDTGDPNYKTVKYQFERVFGGNDQIAMAVRPDWYLYKATINNLYSGGNAGDMTFYDDSDPDNIKGGILLSLTSDSLTVNNVYGGCRMANVNPDKKEFHKETINGVEFPANYAARVLITAGEINNVYGGNDISGNIFGGNAVEIRSCINGNVYGGGNGSYPYTDSHAFVDANPEYADYLFEGGANPVAALHAHRPNAESVWMHVTGTSETKPTCIGGALFLGGNSASLHIDSLTTLTAELKIGAYVTIDSVFMGSNGENMITPEIIEHYITPGFSSIDLTSEFAEYMNAITVDIMPVLTFDDMTGKEYTTHIGALYYGGNVGSMSAPGTFEMNFDEPVVVFNRIVGGCNDANVDTIFAENGIDVLLTPNYKGGLLTRPDNEDDPKVRININSGRNGNGLKIVPKRLDYTSGIGSHAHHLEWDIVGTGEDRRLFGGNIFGGCFNSGYINGSVEINIFTNVTDTLQIFRTQGEENSGIEKSYQLDYVFDKILGAFGGGYGEKTEVWGNTTINVDSAGYIMQVFGGGKRGVVGKTEAGTDANGNPNIAADGIYNTLINLKDGHVDKIYGGGYEGLVSGNTSIYLDGGYANSVFGGACKADINGYSEIFIGANGFPEITNVYGGNDFGGHIYSKGTHAGYGSAQKESNTYVEFLQGDIDKLFGGSYGYYCYSDTSSAYYGYNQPCFEGSFVNIKSYPNTNNFIGSIFGGSYGHPDVLYQLMQFDSYVLVDAPNLILHESDIFGGGMSTGFKDKGTSTVDLYRGSFRNVFGGSLNCGIVPRSTINVPEESSIIVMSLFGGGLGSTNNRRCDVDTAYIEYHSSNARVDNAIFGGNCSYRRTIESYVNISAAVYNLKDQLADVYGGGYGESTWAECTHVNLQDGARVNSVYGGGNEGKVYNNEAVVATGFPQSTPKSSYLEGEYNTNINIFEGALVDSCVYGGGYGVQATVTGTTGVNLLGGTVMLDIFGGGENGHILNEAALGTTSDVSTNVNLIGGTVRNAYGGGYNGNIGSVALPDGVTNVIVGITDSTAFNNGVPAIKRSIYGGGYKGKVHGTAKTNMYNGYIGYSYNKNGSDDIGTTDFNEKYEEYLNLPNSTFNLLKDNGNLFGGGYSEGAITDTTIVNLYGGHIRNSLYGGGEISSIGYGTDENGVIPNTHSDFRAGATNVHMYGGQVHRNVFGGGRGYAIDSYGNTESGLIVYSDGYVFGTTSVYIYRGTIGTPFTVLEGEGNVFGGGNIGYVYSGKGTESNLDGYYYNTDTLTEDCKVIITPKCLVTTAFDSYQVGDYVDADFMNTLPNNSPIWHNMDDLGIKIGNAVFAGGNVSRGSDIIYANTETVFGNATASIIDIFDKDFISIGEDGLGGLYGDGNLTLVDGYRELNITNYGTDYYSLDASLTFEQYQNLNKRERAYYELKYQSKSKHTYSFYESLSLHTYEYTVDEGEGPVTVRVTYKRGQKITAADWSSLSTEEQANFRQSARSYEENEQITENEYDLMDSAEKENWELYGFCTLYLGRMINTIQRADFCGVFGSRIVLRGAEDRATSIVDYTHYTINRVDELSLNRENQLVGGMNMSHGNYFGIYSVVNYLGALTSDVGFDEIRHTDVAEYQTSFMMLVDSVETEINYGDSLATYYNWKYANLNNRKRNNGTSDNEVALASGVWLEILDKETENSDEKIYGPITGIIQLNLINVSTGEGGGYVYVKNEHRISEKNAYVKVALAAANKERGAVSYKQFDYYAEDDPTYPAIKMQTSGNFVNSQKRIIDDCYPNQGKYIGSDAVPAHYWYIRGDYYVYNQIISAYTTSRAYVEQTSIPLTVTPESQGRLTLNSVEKNLHAYWDDDNLLPKYQSPTVPGAIIIGGKTYLKNDPISAWDYSLLAEDEKNFFVDYETYVCSYDIEVNGTAYTEGTVFTTLPESIADYYVCTHTITNNDTIVYNKGDAVTKTAYDNMSKTDQNKCARAFNPSNAVTSDNGFLLTLSWDNPDVWNNYFQYMDNTPPSGTSQILRQSLMTPELEHDYVPGPTFNCIESGIYGQVEYLTGDIIDSLTYSAQDLISGKLADYGILDEQAVFKEAYVTKIECSFTENAGGTPVTYHFTKGACVTVDEYNSFSPENRNFFEKGMLCIETYSVDDNEFYLSGEVIPESTYNALVAAEPTAVDFFSKAYLCESSGHWGGFEYIEGNNYSAIRYSNLSSLERANFSYNYDALDLLSENFLPKIDEYLGMLPYQGEGHGITPQIPFAERQPIDYTATYIGTATIDLEETVYVTRGGIHQSTDQLMTNDSLINTEYEKLTNEQFHFAPIVVSGDDPVDKIYYVVNNDFQVGNDWYTVGQKIEESKYDLLSLENKANVSCINRSDLPDLPTGLNIKRYYFCSKPYTAKTGITDVLTSVTYNPSDEIPIGIIIVEDEYGHLINEQKNFIINGVIPIETTTFYVAREIDINQLSEDKIITVTYLYEYIESDESGTSYETVLERHIVNILIHFESGVPTIGELLPPATVLPGDVVGLNKPTVSKGAFEILGGRWEIFSNEQDAIGHRNGSEFISNRTPIYWYEDGYWLAYYAKSYLGKTYSNPVQFSVANYHRMADVISSTHIETDTLGTSHTIYDYMYLNEAIPTGKRAPKVYIKTAAELDNLAAFYTLTKGGGVGFENIANCENIDFILDGNINHTAAWTPIGENGNCFSGTLHGDGYTISGLDHSLFNYLCGSVYNLGVTGSFTGSGIAENGGTALNCWVMTTGTVDPGTTKAVMGTGIIHNSYYPETNTFAAGSAISKPLKSFLNGEVAYNLNGFYLNKRYYDLNVPGGAKVSYDYWKSEDAGVAGKTPVSSYYPSGYEMYVEERFGNIDFTYAEGTIPTNKDIRSYGDDDFAPIYPDDYIYFGQKLTYGIVSGAGTHIEVPTAVIRDPANGKIVTGLTGNRVNRAPGYYGNSSMSQVYFNRNAGFKSSYNGTDVYKDLTAIDLTGYNDNSSTNGADQNRFFAPILDYGSLAGFITDGLTRNLLVYAKESESATFTVLTTNLPEATFTYNSTYSTVAVPANAAVVKGHLVTLKDGAYIADRNHYLVDKQNFNAPISYQFDNGHYMWYQRTPDNATDRYIKDLNEGWETISLPFTADLVTTQTKGEITHFYGGSNIGHEYWLREFNSVNVSQDEFLNDIFTGVFSSPAADAAAGMKTVTNSYLWDYYYSKFTRKDKNEDLYKHYQGAEDSSKDYYRTAREYDNYPFFTAGRPYLIGFPGETYYEFDLSGTFKAQNTYSDIPKIAKQTITFVSVDEATIGISDSDYSLKSVENDGYRFNSSYRAVNLAAGEGYMLNSGEAVQPSSKFVKNAAATVTVPFRPYFTEVSGSPAPSRTATRADVLLIGYAGDNDGDPIADMVNDHGLAIYAIDRTIWIESTLEKPVKIDVFTAAGRPVGSVIVQPGGKESIGVNGSGVYIVNRRKVAVL